MADETRGSRHVSLWLEDLPATAYPQLDGDRSCDVAVIGGGITGLTAALLLAREGMSVCLLERGSIGTGTSGYTTAKVTSQHHLTYARIRLTHGKRAAATYGAAMEAAKERVASFADEGIDCDFRRRPAYVYAGRAAERALVERETRAAQEAGLPVSFDEAVPLPFPTYGGLRFDNQVEIHAGKYLRGLADRAVEAGTQIFERTRAVQVRESDPCEVATDHGQVRAGHVLVATLLPFLDRGGYFARAYASRSYVLTARVNGGLPAAGLISAARPLHSIRSVPFRGEELLMVLGESHPVGSTKATPQRYDRLAEFARRHWDVISFEHRWSAQDYSPDDGVPFIGRLNLRSHRVHVATGFKRWGLTAGTLAAMLTTDAIAGRTNEWAGLFAATRVKPLAEVPRFVTENSRVGFRFVADRVPFPGLRSAHELGDGEGGVVSLDGKKVAGYRDDAGRLQAVSARCTHLGCQVTWNSAERSWDCPCHGSRFSPAGEVLNGPATKPLDQIVGF